MRNRKLNPLRVDWVVCFVAISCALVASWTVWALEEQRRQESLLQERMAALRTAEEVRNNLEQVLVDSQIRAKGMATAVAVVGEISQDEFSKLAGQFVGDQSAIINLAYVEGYTVKLVHPYATNQSFVGRDLSQIPQQKSVLDRSYASEQPMIQGLVGLIQGIPGVIIRMPVDRIDIGGVSSEAARPGLVTAVIDAEAMLRLALNAAQAESAAQKYLVSLSSNTDTSAVVGDIAVVANSPSISRLTLSGVDIDVNVVPRLGWGGAYQRSLDLIWYAALLSLLFILFTIGLRRQTHERNTAQTRLSVALDSLTDAFVLFDKDNQLVLSNARYAEMHHEYADAIKPGVTLEEILRLGLRHNKFPEAVGREEDWLAERLSAPPEAGRDIEVQFSSGRWFRVLEKRTPDGGRVGLRIETTKQVEIRNRAEAAEAESEETRRQLITAVETLPDGFVLFDRDDRLVLCNSRFRRIYALTANAMVPGTSFEDILRYGLTNGQFKQAIGREEEWLQQRMEEHARSNQTVEQQLADGTWLRIIERKTPDGGRVGLRIDITDQFRSKERAEKAERMLREAIDALPAGFRLFDQNGKLSAVNRYYRDLYELSAPHIRLGATSREMLEKGLELGEYPAAVGREQEWLADVMGKVADGDYEWEYPLQNGRWVRSYNRVVSDGSRVGIQVDITELKRQQSQLEETNEQLRSALSARDAAQTRFADLAEISDDWFWEQDDQLRFTFISEGFDRVSGGGAKDLIGKSRYDLFGEGTGTDSEGDWDWLQRREKARKPFKNFVYRSFGVGKKSRWIQVSGSPVFDANGTFTGYRGVGADITKLYQAMRSAEAASRAKTEFLNVMSHELRTPMTVVLGFNAFLRKPELLPSIKAMNAALADQPDLAPGFEAVTRDIALYANKMDVSGNHLLSLINDMLDLAKIDAGKLDVELGPVSLEDTIDVVLTQFELSAKDKGITLQADVGVDNVFADERRLRQVLINLVGNAIKFTDAGSIMIKTRNHKTGAVVQVIDTGCGIPDEQQKLVFEQFRQADSTATRNAGGTGLGLAISKRLVELMGGELTLVSQLGRGSMFSFTLKSASLKLTSQDRIDQPIA